MTDPEKIPDTWCAMWSDDAALAHDLIAPDGRQWAGTRAGLDDVVGPGATQQFVAAYQQERGIRFAPRTLVIDGADRLAYTWDATLRDGTVLTGADVCVLRDGLVADNWTIVGERRAPTPDIAGAGGATRADLAAAVAGWTPLWNGDTSRPADVVTPDASIWLARNPDGADEVRGPEAMAAYAQRFRSTRTGLTLVPHREPVLDVARGTAALLWQGVVDGRAVAGGIDVLAVRDGRVAHAWTFVSTRPMRY
ncbi:nuclear transport factor 2 family protein [Pseudonocardia sp. CA-107938]|uniref:nuclear transport factor 2 family protein n=1 Tax=Pseudonocardia sp. CA-107938 TaxID=3240021 RepID=UPI003D929DFC